MDIIRYIIIQGILSIDVKYLEVRYARYDAIHQGCLANPLNPKDFSNPSPWKALGKPINFCYSGCYISNWWVWTAGQDGKGYGVFDKIKAYKFAYELKNGKVPTGFELDHLCHTQDKTCPGGDTCKHRLCVRPSHLEVVTKRVNLMRGNSPAAINARKTYCNNGHEYTPRNTYINYKTGKRRCIVCRNAYRRDHYLKSKGQGS